jgi:hypothetical protein
LHGRWLLLHDRRLLLHDGRRLLHDGRRLLHDWLPLLMHDWLPLRVHDRRRLLLHDGLQLLWLKVSRRGMGEVVLLWHGRRTALAARQENGGNRRQKGLRLLLQLLLLLLLQLLLLLLLQLLLMLLVPRYQAGMIRQCGHTAFLGALSAHRWRISQTVGRWWRTLITALNGWQQAAREARRSVGRSAFLLLRFAILLPGVRLRN